VAGLAFVDSIAQFRVPNVVLAELDHPTGQINVWSGYGLLEYDGKTWKGTGHLGSVSIPSISSETTSEDVVFTLTGVDPEYLDGLEQTVRGRIGCVWLGVVSPERKIVHTNKVNADAPLEWGINDCCMTIGDALKSQFGVDLMENWRGKYTTQLGYTRLIKAEGFKDLEGAILETAINREFRPVTGVSKDYDLGVIGYFDASVGMHLKAPSFYLDGLWLVRGYRGPLYFKMNLEGAYRYG